MRIADRVAVGGNATLEDDVKVEPDSVIAVGARVAKGTTVTAGSLWAGSPAHFIRELEPEERESIVADALAVSLAADVHATECAKSPEQRDAEREAFFDRNLHSNLILEDNPGRWELFVNTNPNPDRNAHRRGLVFDKQPA